MGYHVLSNSLTRLTHMAGYMYGNGTCPNLNSHSLSGIRTAWLINTGGVHSFHHQWSFTCSTNTNLSVNELTYINCMGWLWDWHTWKKKTNYTASVASKYRAKTLVVFIVYISTIHKPIGYCNIGTIMWLAVGMVHTPEINSQGYWDSLQHRRSAHIFYIIIELDHINKTDVMTHDWETNSQSQLH